MWKYAAAAVMGGGAGIGLSSYYSPSWAAAPAAVKAGEYRRDLPSYQIDEIKKHRDPKKGRVWVMYKAGVYDVTDFIDSHPGGRGRIMLAAGASIEPFWRQFKIHQQDEVRKILESHRIGNFAGFDAAAAEKEAKAQEEAAERMWDNEPERHDALQVKSRRPFNAETPADALTGAGTVANDLYFVRNHMPVPAKVDLDKFCLDVGGEGVKSHCFSLAELKSKFREHTVATTIQCGGNRRTDAAAAGHTVKGLAWTSGAIGTSTWTGVWLRDILMNVAEGDASAIQGHVRFGGLDSDAASGFEVSIPASMATSPDRDVLIAYKMNDDPIPMDHGFPLRAVVPGTVGVRNCKWLKSITVHPEESQSDWQQRDYKNFPPWLKQPEPGLPSIYDTPVTSRITEATRDGESVTVKGYAFCGGGRDVMRVDVSADNGETFQREADLDDMDIKQPENKRWAWYQFEKTFDLQGADAKKAEASENPMFDICVRAVSGTNDVQPRYAAANFRGLMYNGYSCVKV